MFFSINQHTLDNFPCHFEVGPFVINTDAGWCRHDQGAVTVVYKGYADDFKLSDNLEKIINQHEPVYLGNFCAFVIDRSVDQLTIKTDRYRGFPLYVDDGAQVTNLVPVGRTVWTDGVVTIDRNLESTQFEFDVIGNIDTSSLTKDQVIDKISALLDAKVLAFLSHNTLPVKAFLSGGVDTLLIYSFLKKHTANFELVMGTHVDWDYFWLKNARDIIGYWSYKQIHHWSQDCVLTSGAVGDEFMMRSPATVDQYLKHHGHRVIDLLNQPQWANCKHWDYFLQDKNMHMFATQRASALPTDQLYRELCNNILNDWQHWHLGRTLTWTPLRDLEIFKLIMRLPIDDAVSQALDSTLSIDIIEQNSPGLSQVIADRKNSRNDLANLTRLLL